MTTADELVLPGGSVLLHIGPHKTGTTAVQSAFHAARRSLARAGGRYAGPDRHPVVAAQAAIEPSTPGRKRAHPVDAWRRIVAEVARARDERVVVSSEWFADAEPDAISRIVAELGRSRVHVVITLRPLVRLLPSQWQQHVAAGATIGYEPWLESIFGELDPAIARTFWHRHRHDELIGRWAAVVGPPRIVVVVADDADRGALLRSFERLTGVQQGSLVPEAARLNRSFTLPETEALRAINEALQTTLDDPNLRLNIGLYGCAASLRLREPAPSEPRIETPAWARERATEVAHEIVSGIRELGVRVIGDLATLDRDEHVASTTAPPTAPADATARLASPAPAAAPDPAEDSASWWPDIVAAAGSGALAASGLGRARTSVRHSLAPLSTDRLLRVVVQRVRDAARQRRRAMRGRRASSTVRSESSRATSRPGRALSSDERAALDRFRAKLTSEGLPGTLYDRLVRDGLELELLRDAGDWPRIGAALVVGVVRASGLTPGDGPRRALPPPRARTETLEVARVRTHAVALEIGRRLVTGIPGRLLGRPS